MESARGILLRKTRFSDSSLIVTWLVPEGGRLKTIAKGALRKNSPTGPALDLFHECQIVFSRSRRSDLHPLREAHALRRFEGIRKRWLRAATAGYFAELAEQFSEPEHPAPELYDLLGRALDFLDRNEPTTKALVHFETELAKQVGVSGGPGGALAHSALLGIAGKLPRGRADLLARIRAGESSKPAIEAGPGK